MPKQRLELIWIGKNNRVKLEPRILIEDPEKSFGDPNTENMLIHGDNLLALKALEQEYSGKVKCIYIDPPYNTGSAFEHYDDGLEHSIWLNLIRERIVILWNLLEENKGTLWVSIDDREMAYMKIVLDEICGRDKFVASNVWQKRYSRENREAIGDVHEYILVYAKNTKVFKENRNKLPLGEKQRKIYKNPNNDPRGLWRSVSLSAQGYRPNQMYEIISPITGKRHTPPPGSCWKIVESKYHELLNNNRIYFGKNGNAVPSRKQFLKDIEGMVPWTWWNHEEVGHTDEAKKEMHYLFNPENAFPTPKPERLIQRILHIATNPGDTILDSFLGSGTTTAVAQKMGRRWIGVELGDHCYTHCKLRMDKVISGEDQGGISKAVEWQGGGGYKFYELAPSLLNKDSFGNWIINKKYNVDMLAAAMAKHEGFKYSPDPEIYWKQGQSTEQDYIFTTTEFFTQEHLDHIESQMKEEESLLICCKAFNADDKRYPNITIKKIPQILMGKCEFGKEDYSLNIINIPFERDIQEIPPDEPDISEVKQKPRYVAGQQELFNLEGSNE